MTIAEVVNAPDAPLPPRIQTMIFRIAKTATLRDRRWNVRDAELVARWHEQLELRALADSIRARSGILVKPHYESRNKTRMEKKAVEKRIIALLAEKEKMTPDDFCNALHRTRRYINQVLRYLKECGSIVVVSRRYYVLASKEEE